MRKKHTDILKISQALYKYTLVADICIAYIRNSDAANAAHRCGRDAATTVVQDHWVGAEWVHCFCAPCGMAHLAFHIGKSSLHHRTRSWKAWCVASFCMFDIGFRMLNPQKKVKGYFCSTQETISAAPFGFLCYEQVRNISTIICIYLAPCPSYSKSNSKLFQWGCFRIGFRSDDHTVKR